MAVIGTFGSFTTARLGIYASQASLQVTGNNIANINTRGYTRQRADLVSLNSTGVAKYANPMGVDIGYGVLVKSTTQLRDPYLDIRFRNENTKLGGVNATLAGLNKIAETLDEVNKGGESQNGIIENALQEFKTMLTKLATNVGSEEYDGLVREAAKSLTTFFNTAAENLQTDWNLQADELRDTVKDVNKCLTNIRDLNEQIRKQGIYGDQALELRDARNLYIDELSEYIGINVEYSMERIDQYTEVEKLTISLADTKDPKTGQPIKIIDGLFGAQFSFSEVEVNPNYNPNEPQELLKSNDPAKPYLDENGQPTDDVTKAVAVRLNPKFDESAPTELRKDANGNLIDKDGNVVTEEALAKVLLNAAYDEEATKPIPHPTETGKWLAEDGTATDDVTLAVKAKRNPADKDGSLPYLDAKGNPTDDIKNAAKAPLKYLDENGKPTNDIEKAASAPLKYLDKDGNPTYDVDKAAMASRKYMTSDGKETNDIDQAGKVDPNKFLMQVERLEDKFGRPLNRNLSTESVAVPLNDNDLAGALQAMRELLTEEGEFASKKDVGREDGNLNYSDRRAMDTNANIKKGIPYYQKRLDALARKFATILNEANQLPATTVYQTDNLGNVDLNSAAADKLKFLDKAGQPIKDGDGTVITVDMVTRLVEVKDSDGNVVNDDNGKPLMKRVPLDSPEALADFKATNPTEAEMKAFNEQVTKSAVCLEILRNNAAPTEGYEYYDGGVLFSNSGNNNDPSNITAGNISIANSWASRIVRVLNTKEKDVIGPHSSDSTNIDHIKTLIDRQLTYAATEIEPDAAGGDKIFFHGSFQEMYTDIGATLGSAQSTIMGIASNYEIMTLDLDNDRISVSGVDLNDEATNMMQFQKSYQAACRLLTTIDSMLDTLINGTAR